MSKSSHNCHRIEATQIARLLLTCLLVSLSASCDRTPKSLDETKATKTPAEQQPSSEEPAFVLSGTKNLDVYANTKESTMTGASLRQQGPACYIFWGIWCGSCHEELSYLHQWDTNNPGTPLAIITVQHDGPEQKARAIEELDKNQWGFPTIFPSDELLKKTNPKGFTPTTRCVDSEGVPTIGFVGFGPKQQKSLNRHLSQYLSGG